MDAYLISNERGCIITKGPNAARIAEGLNHCGVSGSWRDIGTCGLLSKVPSDMARRVVAKMLFPMRHNATGQA